MNLKIKRLNILNRTDSLLAFVDVEYEGLEINGCRIVDSKNGMFVSMPREKGKDEKYYDICRFTDVSLKRQFEEQIINEYWANKKVSNINTNQSLPLIE